MKPDININGPRELRGYSDTGYKRDTGTRKNVTGYIVLINEVVIAWNLGSHKIVTPSVIVAEYKAITKICFERIFFSEILLFMGVVVEYPITTHVNNVGAISLSDNTYLSQKTKHIYVCHPLICD